MQYSVVPPVAVFTKETREYTCTSAFIEYMCTPLLFSGSRELRPVSVVPVAGAWSVSCCACDGLFTSSAALENHGSLWMCTSRAWCVSLLFLLISCFESHKFQPFAFDYCVTEKIPRSVISPSNTSSSNDRPSNMSAQGENEVARMANWSQRVNKEIQGALDWYKEWGIIFTQENNTEPPSVEELIRQKTAELRR